MALTRKNRSYFTTAVAAVDRFRTGDKPTEANFTNLFNSVAFLTESNDTATSSTQGLVKLCDDTNAYGTISTADSDGFAKVVRPHQLPIVAAGTNISVTAANNSTGRTGGTGARYTIANTLDITTSVAIPFITVTQSATGADIDLAYSSANFNTAIDGSTVMNTAQSDITTLQTQVGQLQSATQDAWTTLGGTWIYTDAAAVTHALTPTGTYRYKKMTTSSSASKITHVQIAATGLDLAQTADEVASITVSGLSASVAPEYNLRVPVILIEQAGTDRTWSGYLSWDAAATTFIVKFWAVDGGGATGFSLGDGLGTLDNTNTTGELYATFTYESDF